MKQINYLYIYNRFYLVPQTSQQFLRSNWRFEFGVYVKGLVVNITKKCKIVFSAVSPGRYLNNTPLELSQHMIYEIRIRTWPSAVRL